MRRGRSFLRVYLRPEVPMAFIHSRIPILCSLLLFQGLKAEIAVRFDIDLAKEVHSISPFIYGVNSDGMGATEGISLRRSGGNRLTGYNWENNASNAGSDWNMSS